MHTQRPPPPTPTHTRHAHTHTTIHTTYARLDGKAVHTCVQGRAVLTYVPYLPVHAIRGSQDSCTKLRFERESSVHALILVAPPALLQLCAAAAPSWPTMRVDVRELKRIANLSISSSFSLPLLLLLVCRTPLPVDYGSLQQRLIITL
jgi:hypothetical protein